MTTVDEQALAHDPRDQQADTMVEALAHARLRSGMFGVRDDVHAPRLDRYTILERLGSGGFGTVFAAYDERLDRKVAIKVVRVGAGRRASERLVDEAKALAKLAHPNIVAVFDVNPLPGGEVVVAMEFIRGQTLAQWASQPRPWPELFEVFAQAARGLSAAHVASVVHRDFKPTNAIVGDDGRVRVLDFGLARVADGPSDPDDTTDRPLPATGVVGTAAYMPPEQHRGQPADARSDQYAWCVSVWEAVFGTVPYVGDTHEALLQAKLAGPPTPPDAPVPARVRAALTRGLDPEPSRRFDHMQGLVDAMIDTPSAWGRRLLWAAPVVLAAGGALAAAVVAPDDPCLGAAAGLDKIWNETVHDQVRDAFVATQRPYANRVADVVQETVQPWTQTWRDAQTQLCRARQQGTWSDTLLDRQAHCLRTRLSDLQARVHTWADADTTTVDKAEETAAALPSVSYCADPERLRQATPLPTDSGAVAQIEAWAARLSRARANEDAGRYQPAQDGADAVLIAYEQSAIDYPPIRARALIQRGRAASRLGQAKPARQDLEAGSLLALGNGQDRLFADAAAELVWELGQVGGRFDEGERWAKLGQAAIALIGDPEVVLLDEPSAGLDPVSRRNLWSVILRTMSHRAVILTTHSMDEADALCKRIGIMVHGQLRALGTKQHLKNKFGSGFELVVKLVVHDLDKQMEALTVFVREMFPSAKVISENGGLLTYQIPREEMKMGLAFTQLEAHKADLDIEDYSVAQPTLEQVFIRTVSKYSENPADKNAGSVTKIGGSARMSVEGSGLVDDKPKDGEEQEGVLNGLADEESIMVLNKCGCSNRTMLVIMLVLFVLCIILIGVAIGVSVANKSAAGVVWIFALLCLIALIVSCCVRYCAVCKYPQHEDNE